jgi:hypothetical protein
VKSEAFHGYQFRHRPIIFFALSGTPLYAAFSGMPL